MKTISLKIDEAVFTETEKILSVIRKPRNRYINEALDHYNRQQKRRLIKEKLIEESKLVSEESLAVLKEFEHLEEDDPTI
jgi:hypothetical protein